ncbi:glutamine synthetase family protein [Dictyobacter arantiisoli]|uniref:Glutamine synthetase n=1 Tax=Dictyobacter arantiisoli TaxID=2014874 RepID=A0A5A5T9D1_9CHLR|nr:glutamine synthetase family protein [Dictyobacter arantiisoli]GCF07776.1 glutamine synthetase [Dictyobacter arantiisoli]
MDLAQVNLLIAEGKIEFVKLGVSDIDGVFRGKRVTASFFLDGLEDGFAQSDVLFGWDIAENVLPDLKVSNIDRGFGDFIMKPDLSTFTVVPWEEGVATCVCDLWTEHGAAITVAPRYVLQKLIERAQSLGFAPMAASELEMRFFREDQVSLRAKDFGPQLTPLSPGTNCYVISHATADDYLLGQIVRQMQKYGIEIEGYNREHGPGMYEINMHYNRALTAADHTMLFKTGVKEICHQTGFTPTFMAKWNDLEDGSSGHSHLSLWDRNYERNMFWDDASQDHMSTTMRQFLAGVLQKMPEFMALYAPVINSYKRYIEGTWTPLNTAWGMDNRTCAVRVINSGRRSIRLENRVPGADANFYLVFAGMLASGLYGIEKKLELPSRLDGNAYSPARIQQALTRGEMHPLARNLTTATDLFEQSAVAKEYLGTDFVEHFVTTRRWEVQEYEKAVTNWERRRYLELI